MTLFRMEYEELDRLDITVRFRSVVVIIRASVPIRLEMMLKALERCGLADVGRKCYESFRSSKKSFLFFQQ